MGKKRKELERRKKERRERNQMLSTHHIIPTSRGGTDSPSNLKTVCVLKHRAWHALFSNMLPEEAIELIRKEWM
ncbi:MAG: HNH endonuclease [Candidatus Roizmanbacteria bacterium]|nr:HNH endonuclease [Candidatus Roizmanbacteria bacterium]